MKAYINFSEMYSEEAMTTGSGGLGTGAEIPADDMRVPTGPLSGDARNYQKKQGGVGADEGGEN